ncbi:MAG: hypothetical protein ACK4N5_03445 [Myxococcales bacterium]
MNTRLTLLALALAFAPACARSINPQTQALTNQLLQETRNARDVGAPASYEPKPWKAGQWVLYRVTQNGKDPQVTRIKVVEQTSDGFWIETEQVDYYNRTLTRVLYSRQPRNYDEAVDAIQKIITRQDDGDPQEQDFTQDNELVRMMKRTMKHVGNGLVAPTDVSSAPREDVTVPAGSFKSTAKFEAALFLGPIEKRFTGWYHPEVPLNGGVKTVTTDGEWTHELLDFGHSGATSSF